MESKQESYKDQFTAWRPMEQALPDDEVIHYHLFEGVGIDEFLMGWVDVEVMIGGMMYCSALYVKTQTRFKE